LELVYHSFINFCPKKKKKARDGLLIYKYISQVPEGRIRPSH